jgi:hypothetical protein
MMRAEHVQSILALTLSAIRMNRSHRQALVVEEVINRVALELGVGEDQDATGLFGEDEIKQRLVLLVLVDVDDLLSNVLVGAADAANPGVISVHGFKFGNQDNGLRAFDSRDSDYLLLHVFLGKTAGGLGERGREHEIGMITITIDVCK